MNIAKLVVLMMSWVALGSSVALAGDQAPLGVIVESTTPETVIVESTTDETCARLMRPQGQKAALLDWYRNEIYAWLVQLLLR